jgi:uncharacterized protein HemX
VATQEEPYKPFEKVTPEELQRPPTEAPQNSPPQNQKQPSRGLSPAVSVLTIVLISIALFLGGYFYLQYQQNQNIEDRQKIESEEKQKEEEKLQQIEENAKNDSIRKLDLATLDNSLEKYFSEKKKYPEKMEELSPDYVRVIPLDPVSKEPYFYEPDEELSSYSLSAKLSDGSDYFLDSDDQ